MFEDYEGLSGISRPEEMACSRSIEDRDVITPTESSYIEEVLPYRDGDLIAARIDELSGSMPPKGIDANKEVAELIESVKENINPIYLEAPSDSIQISESVESLEKIFGARFEDWKGLSLDQRVDTLQAIENKIAEIAHRPSCNLNVQNLGEGYYGYFDPQTKEITVNNYYINSENFNDYKECLDTIIHEGRHAYQDYNMTEREVHPRGTEVDNWRLNNDSSIGYLDAQDWGFELYEYQPMESDARAFAGDILEQFLSTAVSSFISMI